VQPTAYGVSPYLPCAVPPHVNYLVSEKYLEYVRLLRPCSLTISDAEWAKLYSKIKEADREFDRARETK
jgi:hypothetical protein